MHTVIYTEYFYNLLFLLGFMFFEINSYWHINSFSFIWILFILISVNMNMPICYHLHLMDT